MGRALVGFIVCGIVIPLAAQAPAASGTRFLATFPAARSTAPLDGRLLVLLSTDSTDEPRNQISDIYETQLIFGQDVDGWAAGRVAVLDARATGYPLESVRDVPAGRYRVQALLTATRRSIAPTDT